MIENPQNSGLQIWIPDCMKFDIPRSIKSKNVAPLRKITKPVLRGDIASIASIFGRKLFGSKSAKMKILLCKVDMVICLPKRRLCNFSPRGYFFGFYGPWNTKLYTVRYTNLYLSILGDFFSIRFQPHQILT